MSAIIERTYTVTLPLSDGPDLIDALSMFVDNNDLSPAESTALMTLFNAIESAYNHKVENPQ